MTFSEDIFYLENKKDGAHGAKYSFTHLTNDDVIVTKHVLVKPWATDMGRFETPFCETMERDAARCLWQKLVLEEGYTAAKDGYL